MNELTKTHDIPEWLILNSQIMDEFGNISDLSKDNEAANSYFLNYVNPKTRFYHNLNEKIKYLTENDFYEKDFLEQYKKEEIEEIFNIAYKAKFRFPTYMGAFKFYNDYALKSNDKSVFLETCLFYSGFYYPLYFYGQGKLMQAGEIINLILRDESIHGLYIGRMGIDLYQTFNDENKKLLYDWVIETINELYINQSELVDSIYDAVDLSHDVKIFVRYNANKALMNLGFDPYFEHEEVNPVVLNGLNTETKTMDNFSMKGNGYQKMKSETLKDEDFNFVDLCIR